MGGESFYRLYFSTIELCVCGRNNVCLQYKQWISENKGSVTEEEMKKRREQLELYQEVLEIYGSDSEWEALTHAQRVKRNKEASETSLRAKEMGPPPDAVSLASVRSRRERDDDDDDNDDDDDDDTLLHQNLMESGLLVFLTSAVIEVNFV